MIDIVDLAICGVINESVSLFRSKQDALQFVFSFPQLSYPFLHLLIALQGLNKQVTSTFLTLTRHTTCCLLLARGWGCGGYGVKVWFLSKIML